ncbi:protease inhibitor I42 family protein [Patescibacteria group bacterium]|nr:protease inhibitor I42 family protein [Patescibacteria group bacterium]
MFQQKISKEFLEKAALVIILLLIAGIISGVVMLLSNRTAINPLVMPSPVVTSSPVSDIRKAVLGEDFLITLPSNPSTGYSWTADFDENYLFLRSKDFVADKVNPKTVGAGGTEVFTFAPIKAGETIITMGYGRSWESKQSETKVFRYEIKEKTVVDARCEQKAKFFNNPKECEVAAIGFEFDSITKKCTVKSSGECGVETPFNSLEECQKTCETGAVSGNELKFETIIRDYNSNQTAQNNYVIKSEAEWIPVLQKTNAGLPAPIDFNKEIVIAVFQGEKSTGGYSIEIQKIIENENNIEVFVNETSPGKNCMVTQAFTSPFQVVKVQRSDKEVVFETEKVVTVCE